MEWSSELGGIVRALTCLNRDPSKQNNSNTFQHQQQRHLKDARPVTSQIKTKASPFHPVSPGCPFGGSDVPDPDVAAATDTVGPTLEVRRPVGSMVDHMADLAMLPGNFLVKP